MILIVDGGGTKTDCAVVDGSSVVARLTFPGINPAHLSDREIAEALSGLSRATSGMRIQKVFFYGAGCTDDNAERLRAALSEVFAFGGGGVTVKSDMEGAVSALFGTRRGIACILGTGSNSCLCEGGKVVENIPPLGFILGDEGGGAALGKLFLNALLRGRLPEDVTKAFFKWSDLTYDEIIERVYRRPMPARFLASFSPFICAHAGEDEALGGIVRENFRAFFRLNVSRYGHRELEVGAVGGVAWHYRPFLSAVAAEEGYVLGSVLKSPLDGIVESFQ